MTLITDNQKREALVKRIQSVLDNHQPRNYRVRVQPDGILEGDDWVKALVVSPGDQRDRDFYDALAESEADLAQLNDGVNYLLVPVLVNE